jgi:hypothetical protein
MAPPLSVNAVTVQTSESLPPAAEQLHEPERPRASLSGTLLASLVGARLCRAFGFLVRDSKEPWWR